MMRYGTDIGVYQLRWVDGGSAIVVAHNSDEALAEVCSLAYDRDLREGAALGLLQPKLEIAAVFEDPDDIDELYDSYLGLIRELKPGFKIEVDEDGDRVVVAPSTRWAEAFAEHAPHVICSSISS